MPSSLIPGDYGAVIIRISNILLGMERPQNVTVGRCFFAAGMDMLQSDGLLRQFRSLFSDHDEGDITHPISSRTVYSKLATTPQYLVDHGKVVPEGFENERISRTEETLAKYIQSLPQPKNYTTLRHEQGLIIVRTGSTGWIGSYFLDRLLARTQVQISSA